MSLPTEVAYCCNCGNQVTTDANYCRKCGHSVGDTASRVEAPPARIVPTEVKGPPKPWKRVVAELAIFLGGALLFSYVVGEWVLFGSRGPQNVREFALAQHLVELSIYLGLSCFFALRALRKVLGKEWEIKTAAMVAAAAYVGLFAYVVATKDLAISAPVQNVQQVWLSPETLITEWKPLSADVLGKPRQAALDKFGQPDAVEGMNHQFLKYSPKESTNWRQLTVGVSDGKVLVVEVYARPEEYLNLFKVIGTLHFHSDIVSDTAYSDTCEEVFIWQTDDTTKVTHFRSAVFYSPEAARSLKQASERAARPSGGIPSGC